MKKSLIIIGIIFVVLLSINNYSQAAGTVSLSANKSSVYVGDEFSISVNLSGTSVATLTTRILIDTSKVEYVSGPSNSNFSNGKVIYTWTDPNGGVSPISSGTIATFKFKAKSKGTANFSITGDFYDASENAVNPAFSGKSVIISEVESPPPTIPTTEENNNTSGTSNPSNNPPNDNITQSNNPTTNNNTSQTNNTGTTTASNLSNNAYLKSLQLNVEGVSPKFNKNITQYYITVANLVDSINITATPENTKAKVSVAGNTALKTGLNKISILVTAQDGKTKQNYIINVTKTDDPNKSNANLENLAIENCTLIPEFNTEITQYNCELQDDLASLKILAIPQNENAKTEINGNENLQMGENIIKVNVTAQDGVTIKTYEIKVNKTERKKVEENLQPQAEEMQVQPKKVNSNRAVIPLAVVGIVAIIDGVCYKKFVKKQ